KVGFALTAVDPHGIEALGNPDKTQKEQNPVFSVSITKEDLKDNLSLQEKIAEWNEFHFEGRTVIHAKVEYAFIGDLQITLFQSGYTASNADDAEKAGEALSELRAVWDGKKIDAKLYRLDTEKPIVLPGKDYAYVVD